MANKTVTVKSSGGDYTSLNAALVGESANLVTNTCILTIKCYAITDTTPAASGSGYTTNASYYINIQTDSSASHSGVWDSTKYNLSYTGNYTNLLVCQPNYTRVKGLQVYLNGNYTAISMNGTTSSIVDSCIIKGSGGQGIGCKAQTIVNCIVYGFGTGFGVIGYETITWYNNTAVGNATGYNISPNVDSGYIKNCLGSGNTTVDFTSGGNAYIITDCASSDSTAGSGGKTGSSGNRVNQTITFVDATNKNYQLASTDAGAKGYGVDLSSDPYYPFNYDVAGNTRTAPWDIGAWMAQSGGVTEYYQDAWANEIGQVPLGHYVREVISY